MGSKFGKILRYGAYFLSNVPSVLGWKLFKKKPQTNHFRGVRHIDLSYTDNVLCQYLEEGKPFAAIRYGAVELSCLNNHEKIALGLKKTYKEPVRFSMKNNAGFFPCEDASLKEYGDSLLPKLNEVDLLGISGVHMENYFTATYAPNAKPILYEGMEPLHGEWVKHLEGKKVLVISPFVEEIAFQYERKAALFKEEGLPPNMELKLIRSPLTLADEVPEAPSFFAALEEMEQAMDRTDFDVLLVGAGAYGSFLALYAKKLGKIGIQTGGATPTLFGVLGKRWEKREHVAKHVNENWIRPYTKPKGFEKIEAGAYW